MRELKTDRNLHEKFVAHENSKLSEMDIELMKVLLWTRTSQNRHDPTCCSKECHSMKTRCGSVRVAWFDLWELSKKYWNCQDCVAECRGGNQSSCGYFICTGRNCRRCVIFYGKLRVPLTNQDVFCATVPVFVLLVSRSSGMSVHWYELCIRRAAFFFFFSRLEGSK